MGQGMFKVGDLVEGEHEGNWVLGTVVDVYEAPEWQILSIHCQDHRNTTENGRNLHSCGGKTPYGKGWIIRSTCASYAKNKIVIDILNDL